MPASKWISEVRARGSQKARFAIIRNTTGFMRSLRLRKRIKEHIVRIRPGRENVEYAGFRLESGR